VNKAGATSLVIEILSPSRARIVHIRRALAQQVFYLRAVGSTDSQDSGFASWSLVQFRSLLMPPLNPQGQKSETKRKTKGKKRKKLEKKNQKQNKEKRVKRK